MKKFGIELEQKWEGILDRITSEPKIRKILDDLYSRADKGCEKFNKDANLDFLLKAGLVEENDGQLILAREIMTVIYNLQEYDIQLGETGMRNTLRDMVMDGSSSVLDVGCGGGQTLMVCLEYCPRRMVGTDIDPVALKLGAYKMSRTDLGKTEVSFRSCPGDNLPYRSNSFTHLVCRGVLHKLDMWQGMGEFDRVLKPGGRLYLLLPSAGYYVWRLFTDTFSPKHFALLLLMLLNGTLFSLSGRQIKIGHRGKTFQEIYISCGKIKKILGKYGFKILEAKKESVWHMTGTYEIIAIKE